MVLHGCPVLPTCTGIAEGRRSRETRRAIAPSLTIPDIPQPTCISISDDWTCPVDRLDKLTRRGDRTEHPKAIAPNAQPKTSPTKIDNFLAGDRWQPEGRSHPSTLYYTGNFRRAIATSSASTTLDRPLSYYRNTSIWADRAI